MLFTYQITYKISPYKVSFEKIIIGEYQ